MIDNETVIIDGVPCYYDKDDHLYRSLETGYRFISKQDLVQAYNLVIEHLLFNGSDERLVLLLQGEVGKVLPNKEE